jgi:hypothetical protein
LISFSTALYIQTFRKSLATEDVPVYPHREVIFAAQSGAGYKVRGVSQDEIAKIDAYYKKYLADEDWTCDTQEMNIDLAESKAYQYKKGEKTLVAKTVANAAETTIEMTYLAEPLKSSAAWSGGQFPGFRLCRWSADYAELNLKGALTIYSIPQAD